MVDEPVPNPSHEERLATVKGLQRAIELLLPSLLLCRTRLEAQGSGASGGNIRAMFRANAIAVGKLRWELDEIAGRPNLDRLSAQESYTSRIEYAGSILDELDATVDPVMRYKLISELEVAEQHADAALVDYAGE